MTSKSTISYMVGQYLKLKTASANSKENGFTMAELLLVICILAILCAMIIPGVAGILYKARRAEADMNIATFIKAQQQYYLKNGVFADNLEDLGIELFTDSPHFGYTVEVEPLGSPIETAEAICLYSYEKDSSGFPNPLDNVASLGCAAKIELPTPSSPTFSSGSDLESNLDVLYKLFQFPRGSISLPTPLSGVTFNFSPPLGDTYQFMTCSGTIPGCQAVN